MWGGGEPQIWPGESIDAKTLEATRARIEYGAAAAVQFITLQQTLAGGQAGQVRPAEAAALRLGRAALGRER
jgi:hypothetical protein